MGLADKLKEMAKTQSSEGVLGKEATETTPSGPLVKEAPKTKAPAEELVQEAGKDFNNSAEQLEKLRANRNESDIPLNDPYWDYRNAHQLAHNSNQFVEKVEKAEEK